MWTSLPFSEFFFSFDYIHKKQSGGSGQYGRVIGKVQVTLYLWSKYQPNIPDFKYVYSQKRVEVA